VLDVGLCQLFDEKLGIIAAFCGSDFDDSFHDALLTGTWKQRPACTSIQHRDARSSFRDRR
jgi:hypothetical protein